MQGNCETRRGLKEDMGTVLEKVNSLGQQNGHFVRQMFARIAPRYDLLNSLLSLRLHHYWRAVAAREAGLQPGQQALDVCTGTADLAIRLAMNTRSSGQIVGIDFCEPMLQIAQSKVQRRSQQQCITLVFGDALRLPFASNSFSVVTIAFGLRNIANIHRAFAEMWRVLKPNGRVVCLEFSHPRTPLFRQVYSLYFHHFLPFIGGLLSHRDAYAYLPDSVSRFPEREQLARMMNEIGFSEVTWKELTFGIVCVHSGVKR